MNNLPIFFWFSFTHQFQHNWDLHFDHGDLYAKLTHLLYHSLAHPAPDEQFEKHLEIEIGFSLLQSWVQMVHHDMNEQSPESLKKIFAFIHHQENQFLSLKDDNFFCYPPLLDPQQKTILSHAILWLLSKSQFKVLREYLVPESILEHMRKSEFYDKFESLVCKPYLTSAFPISQFQSDLFVWADALQNNPLIPPIVKRLLLLSLDRYNEHRRERHSSQPQFESLADSNRFVSGQIVDNTDITSSSSDNLQDDLSTNSISKPDYKPQQNMIPSWGKDLVIISKLIPVWLHQLTLKYQQPITTLDKIPDQELAEIADLGITGLWLVGIWQRSQASKTIKKTLGNEYALGSAYSILDYEIDPDIGGASALKKLKEKALPHGIRLGADVIPNHTAIDSQWLKNNPDWFISLPEPPFPSYSFTGQNLSNQAEFEIKIEDHYYDHRDAAVVFQYQDHHKMPKPIYIYHGNDGTHVPWNDTAQLDYLNPAVRQNMIDTIVRISQDFPIIRLDAAMTLTRLHYKRLWYPPPGEGGAIPSRSGRIESNEEFDRRYGVAEFWQEALAAINRHNPDALLLAEAFWLMEPYFINHIGMHKVYHSAFMNLLRDFYGHRFNEYLEDLLQKYPVSTLKHFVNFLSTPDEAPAALAFGKGDRFMAASILLSTFPGTPLFAHNQWDGLSEQYGMEFAAPIHNVQRDQPFFDFNKSQLLPILKNRSLFSRSEHFKTRLLIGHDQSINKNVIAYTNENQGQKTLTVVNYQDHSINGFIDLSDLLMSNNYSYERLAFSFNSHVDHKDNIEISLAPWGYCVLLFKQT